MPGSQTRKRKRNAPLVNLVAKAKGVTRNMLRFMTRQMPRHGSIKNIFGLKGMFKGNSFKKGAM
jgi:hypothetical protein